MGHLRLLAVLGLIACKPPYLHGGGDDGTGPDAPADDSTPIRSCASSIAYHAGPGVTAVDVAGAWDWSARTPLADPDHDGTFTGEVELAPGIWP